MNVVVIFMLLIQLVVYPTSALGSEKAKITVEQAIQVVKDNFSIPEKYSHLSTGYNEFNNRATYSLNWNAVEEPGGSFNAEVDATTGEIMNINRWENSNRPSFRLPVLSKEDAMKIASDMVSKLASKHQSEMQLINDNQQVFALNNSQPFIYNFRWVRIVNGIPFPGNGVNVSVSGDKGQVMNYYNNWTEGLEFPAASNVISPEAARQVFTDTPMLELQYFLPPIMNPQAQEPQRVLLVYQLSNKYYGGAVDALSGKPLTIDTQGGNNYGVGAENSVKATTAMTSAIITTEAVSPVPVPGPAQPSIGQEVPENTPRISQSEAVDIVKKMIKIPKNLTLQHSSLSPDWQNPSEQVWDIQWNGEYSNFGEQRHLSARVNAMNGDFIGFNQFPSVNSDDKSKPITRKSAQILADNFLKRVQPEKFELIKLEPENIYNGKMPPNIQMFSYVRFVNGIPVSRNGMTITIDAVAKQVTNYEMNWSNLEFPSASDVLPLNQATEKFLKIRPLELNYSLIFIQNEQQELRLVYQPNTDYFTYTPSMIDAKNGDPMDWYGKSQSQWSKSHNFTDIQGHFAEKEIGIMGLTGAFGEYGETFRPDENITVGSLMRAMLTAEGNNRDRVLEDKDVLKLIKERGWDDGNLKLESELNREDLSKIMIRLINMEPSAKVKGIYAVPFADADKIQADSLGYIALAWGLGILKIDDNTLHPEQTVTRAEAAYALVHAYALEPLSSNLK